MGFLLFKTTLVDKLPLQHGLTADGLRRNFKWLVLAAAAAGGGIGWIGGPVLLGEG